MAVSETNPDLVFIGMGETLHPRQHHARGRRLPEPDAGETWEHVGFRDSDAISKIRIHPTNPDIVFVASFGKYGVPSEERGVFKSTDGGDTWRKVLYRDDKTGRHRHQHRPQQSRRDVRGPLGGVPEGIPDVERRPRERHLQEHRRRRDAGPRSPGTRACPRRGSSAASASPCRAPTRTGSTPWWRTTTAASSGATTPAPPGRW